MARRFVDLLRLISTGQAGYRYIIWEIPLWHLSNQQNLMRIHLRLLDVYLPIAIPELTARIGWELYY